MDALSALQRHLLALKARRAGVTAALRAAPYDRLFDRQRQVIEHPSKFKTLRAGRRGGKTDAIISDFAHGMLNEPGSANLYCALTIGSALKIFWKPFKKLNEQHGWGLRFNEGKYEVTHENGSWLAVGGGDTMADLEKYRGMPWRRVRIDECGAWKPSYLEYFVQEVVEPSFMDHDGDLWLAGTPGRQPFGYFYEACNGKNGFTPFYWTAKDNPHVNWQSYIYTPRTGLLARRGWTEESVIFKREYLGLWTVDPADLVYAFDRTRNVIAELPEHKYGYDYGVGFDFGVNNACAYSVQAWPRRVGNVIYTVRTFKAHGLAPSQFAPIANEVLNRYKPVKAVGDSGGLGKAFMQEYSLRYSDWHIEPADKRERRGTLEIVSDMLGSGRKMVLEGNDAVIDEWSTLQWDEDRENTSEGQENDASDADLYISKEAPAFLQRADEPPDEQDEWHRRLTRQHEQQTSYLDVGD